MRTSFTTSIVSASLLALAAAENSTIPPVSVGYYSYPHGSEFVAWTPPPSTTQDLQNLCQSGGGGNLPGTQTFTAISVISSFINVPPACRNPFNLTDPATKTVYQNLELACIDDNIPPSANPQVTAVVDVATGKEIQVCKPIAEDAPVRSTSCVFDSEQFRWSFACS